MRAILLWTVTLAATVAAVACGSGFDTIHATSETTDAGVPDPSAGGTGVPCDVGRVIAANCLVCHGVTPSSSAPMSLVTYADLTAVSAIDPTKKVIERCVIRMVDTTLPMPPGLKPTVSAADIAVLQAWIDAKLPQTTCDPDAGVDAGPDPFMGPEVCTSGKLSKVNKGTLMDPGMACNACHEGPSGGNSPIFTIAGTVFPTAHEPDTCNAPASSKAIVVITDANGKVVSLSVNSAGNFSLDQPAFAFKFPYTAKVVFEGRERAMVAVQTSGDCNSCHTQKGTMSAPGRILLP